MLISLAEAQREDEEGLGSAVSMWMNCMVSMSLFICVAAAIFQIKPLQRSSREGKRRKEEKEEKRKKRKMASDDDLKKLMGNAKSIASVSFVERQLKKKIEERCSVAEGEDQVKELNKQREGHPSPEPKKPESEAGSDPTSSEDEKEEKKDEKEKEKKKEKESSSESSSSDEEKKEEFKKTAEELKQEAVMKGRNKDLEKMKEDAEERRRKVVEAARSLAEKAEETTEETTAVKAEEAEKEKAVEKAEEAEKETATGKAEEIEVDEERRDQEERRRLKTDFDIYTQSLWPVITTDVPEEPQKIRVGLPSQDLERQFNLLREITLKPVSSLPDGYGLRVRELKERVEESVIESEESLSILNDDVKKAAKRVSEAQEGLKSYVEELEKELERKVKQKEALIKEAETDYQAARANGRSWKVRNTLRAVQGLVLVAHVCKVGASAPDDANIVLAQEPASKFSQEVSTGERKLSEGRMLSAVELASGVEIFLLVCGLVYVFKQITKAIRVSLKKCKRKQVEIEMVYIHRGRKVFHLKSCMWYCAPPKTMEMTKEEALNQGFRSCWRCHPEDRPQKKPQEAVGSNTQGRGGICGQRCMWCDEGTCSRQKEVHVHCACTECIRDHAEAVWRSWYDCNKEAWYEDYEEQEEEDQQETSEASWQQVENEGRIRRRVSFVDPGTPDSTEARTQGPMGFGF